MRYTLRTSSSLEYDVYPESEGYVCGYLEARIICIFRLMGIVKLPFWREYGCETDALNIFRWLYKYAGFQQKEWSRLRAIYCQQVPLIIVWPLRFLFTHSLSASSAIRTGYSSGGFFREKELRTH